MFYLSVYAKGSANYYEPWESESYYTEQEAKDRLAELVEQAKNAGANISQDGELTVISGEVIFKYHIEFITRKNDFNAYYLRIEDDTTLYGLASEEKQNYLQSINAKDQIENGHKRLTAHAAYLDNVKKRQAEYRAELIAKLETALNGATDTKTLLATVIKLSRQRSIDKDILIEIAAAKLDNRTTDWYDELSDINS